MIWVTWRQQRAQILATAGIVVVLSAILVYVRLDAAGLRPDLAAISDKYNQFLNYFVLAMLALPPLLGMFAGAPLFAREIEQRTHIFGLTQSVSRKRWLATKIVMAGGSFALSMTILGLVTAWALEPVNFVMRGRLSPPLFEVQGVAVGAYAMVAFAIGTTAGLLLRNTLPAMVVTLVVYVGLLLVVANGIRPGYAEPASFVNPLNSAHIQSEPVESWTVAYGYLDADGKEVDASPVDCSRGQDFTECMRAKNITTGYSKVHLPERFWRFQFTEAGLFLLLSGGLVGFGGWLARRKLT
jgi:hypothetical protein